jgi:hypothetical protein
VICRVDVLDHRRAGSPGYTPRGPGRRAA